MDLTFAKKSGHNRPIAEMRLIEGKIQMTLATSQRDATNYETALIMAVKTNLKENSIAIGSWAIGAKNELAQEGGAIALQLAENLGYDFDVRPSMMKVWKELASYEDRNASQAYQLRQRALVLILENALVVRGMLNKGLL